MSPRTKGKVTAVTTPFSWLAQGTAGYSEEHVVKTLLSNPKSLSTDVNCNTVKTATIKEIFGAENAAFEAWLGDVKCVLTRI